MLFVKMKINKKNKVRFKINVNKSVFSLNRVIL